MQTLLIQVLKFKMSTIQLEPKFDIQMHVYTYRFIESVAEKVKSKNVPEDLPSDLLVIMPKSGMGRSLGTRLARCTLSQAMEG